jgi:hypothetical protein
MQPSDIVIDTLNHNEEKPSIEVICKDGNDPVAQAFVSYKDGSGRLTNLEGVAILKPDSSDFPVKVIIDHVSYGKTEVSIPGSGSYKILVQLKYNLFTDSLQPCDARYAFKRKASGNLCLTSFSDYEGILQKHKMIVKRIQ